LGAASWRLAFAVFGGGAVHALAEDTGEVEAVGEAAVGGDLFDAEVAQNKKLGRLLDADLLDPCGRGCFQMFAKPSDEGAFAERHAAGEPGIGKIFAEVLVDEAKQLIEAHGLFRGRRVIQFGKDRVQQSGRPMIESGQGRGPGCLCVRGQQGVHGGSQGRTEGKGERSFWREAGGLE